MHDPNQPKLSKWPFLLGDGLLFAVAAFISYQSERPLTTWTFGLMAVCVGVGAVLAVVPYVLEYRAVSRMFEASYLAATVSQIKNMEQIAVQIGSATSQWHQVQEAAEKTATGAREITERLGREIKAFSESLERANETEKATLRLEVDKLRRAEGDWLQVVVRILDQVYAVHQGALRSGQPNLIEQISLFQNACREIARRVGLTPFVATEAEPFDSQRHQLLEGDGQASTGALVDITIAAGYTFQGRLLRPALVRLQNNGATSATVVPPAGAQS